RSFGPGEHGGGLRIEGEGLPSVVADDAGGGLEDPGTEPAGQALDERDHPPVTVGRDQGDRVAGAQAPDVDRTGSNLVAQRRDVALVEERAHRDPSGPG